MTEDKEQIYAISSKSLPVRIGLIVLILFTIAFTWFAVRWQIGNLVADITSPNQPNAKGSAEVAKRFAPSDPLANWLVASVEKESDPEYIEGFTNVVRLSPNDYRWWIQLGRAFEEADNEESAEIAFKRALTVAPNYTFPHWQIGNFYLRQDKDEEAFRELQKAAENNSVYREQIFSIAWDYYENDVEKLESIVGKSSDVRAGLAKFYAAKELPQKSLEMWNSLSGEEKQSNAQIAKVITQALYDKRFLLSAVEFVNQLEIEKGAKRETVHNGGFEENFSDEEIVYFGWKTIPTEKVRVRYSTRKKHDGKRSLQVSFTGFNKTEINNLYQTIAVQSGASYRLSFWIKTENLKSAGTPKLDVLNANDYQVLASTDSFSRGTTDWKQISVNFTVPKNTEGVTLRTARTYCGDKCTIFGTFWYDTFELEKVSGE